MSTNSDVTRYCKFYEKCFKEKTLKKNKNFKNTKDDIVWLDEEEEEEALKEKEKFNDLRNQIIVKNKKNNMSLLDTISK